MRLLRQDNNCLRLQKGITIRYKEQSVRVLENDMNSKIRQFTPFKKGKHLEEAKIAQKAENTKHTHLHS